MTSQLRRCLQSSSVQLGLFFALAIVATWPLAKHLQSALPTGTSPAGTVPMLNAWILWWNAESISHGMTEFWNAPAFFPSKGALALNEPQPIYLLLAPVTLSGRSPILSYNVYLLATLTLNGWFATRLLRQLGLNRLIALGGGIAMLLHPLAWRNLEAIQLTALWPVIASLSAAIAVFSSPLENNDVGELHGFRGHWLYKCVAQGLQLGFCVALTGWACLYWLAFTLLTLGPTIGAFALVRRSRRKTMSLVIAAIVSTLLLLPIYLPMRHYAQEHELQRSEQLVESLSADTTDWIATAGYSLWNLQASEHNLALSPGFGKILTCILGCIAIWSGKSLLTAGQRSGFAILTGFLSLSFVFSFGANLEVLGWNLWRSLGLFVPPIQSIRSPFRFAYFVQLAAILISVISVDLVLQQIREKLSQLSRKLLQSLTAVLGFVLVALTIGDSLPQRSMLCFPPSARHKERWREFVATNVEHGNGILCLPVAEYSTEISLERSTRWMMHATAHGVPIANGYSGFTPKLWQNMRRQIREGNINDNFLTLLASNRIRHIVVRTDQMDAGQVALIQSLSGTQLCYSDQRYKIFVIE
ncbi:MAG: hypothetical protein Aurels2KO_29980 [Aureliella sp.]